MKKKGNKRYSIIYADPPWKYACSTRWRLCPTYDVQSIEWLKQLPVSEIADESAILFLWVTMPKLNECFDLIDAWGFTFKTNAFTWVKRNRKSPSWFFGMGAWTRANAELCLLATKGKPKRKSASVSSVIDSPIGSHSQKPDIVRTKIVELAGDLPRIELFARRRVKGWDAWGNEVESDIDLEKIPARLKTHSKSIAQKSPRSKVMP